MSMTHHEILTLKKIQQREAFLRNNHVPTTVYIDNYPFDHREVLPIIASLLQKGFIKPKPSTDYPLDPDVIEYVISNEGINKLAECMY